MLGKTLQIAAAGNAGADAYWIATLGGTGTDYEVEAISVKSNGDVYGVLSTNSEGAGGYDAVVVKYNSSGVLQWQRRIGGSSNEFFQGMAIDDSGNIYAVGSTASYESGTSAYIVKYNSSGAVQWQRALYSTSTIDLRKVAVDSSSSNIYAVGFTSALSSGGNDVFICKYSVSGVLQWQRRLGGTSNDDGSGIALDGSDNVYIQYQHSSGQGGYDLGIAKYNSSGVIQWQRSLGGTSNESGAGLAIDSSDNIYIPAMTVSEGQGNYDAGVAKYNSSGAIQWQRIIGGTGSDNVSDLAVDSSGNVYVFGTTLSAGAGSQDTLIVKYNSSGVAQWQRSFGTTSYEYAGGIAVDSSNNLYFGGRSNVTGNYDSFIVKVPSDGSLTGTYGNFVYASTSLTAATSTLTDAASTLTDQESFYSGTIWDDVENATHVRFDDVNCGGNDPRGLFFKPDGTKVYMLLSNRTMIQTTLSTAWDISTHGSIDYTFPATSFHFYHTLPYGLFISPDGTELYSTDDDYNRLIQYTMSTAWDLSTLSFTATATIGAQDSTPRGVCFSPDGLNMYLTGNSTDKIHRYTLSTAWDISTLSHDSSTSSTVDGFPMGIFMKPDGTRYYVVGQIADKVYQFNPLTAYTLSNVLTSSTDIDSEFSIVNEETFPNSMYISPDGDHMYVGGGAGNGIDQYSLPGSTTAPSLTDAASSLTSSKTNL
jgi:6-phosphogluconolactonase (cycloisomerase 2 family)